MEIMERVKYILLMLTVLSGFISCEQKDLYLCLPEIGNNPVNVVIHWDSVPDNQLVLPKNMTVHWYPASGGLISSDMGVYGGSEMLNGTTYDVMCMDFYGNANLAFRSDGTRKDFEVYNIRMNGTYNLNVPQLPGGETTVVEAYPPHFYIDGRSQSIHAENVPEGDTLTVHFYPKNVMREFTFMIYDVTGAKNMAVNSGAISGISGSYYPASGNLAQTPSTLLFPRVEKIVDAQNDPRWTDAEKALFAAKNPNWASPDTLIGWTRDWITGKFATFGPLDRSSNRFRLTVEAFNGSKNAYHGAWGYWHGQWENTVAAQIDSAMGKNGTLAEQLAWRQRNGGYDIVLYNDNRLIVPEGDGKYSDTDGGFNVTIDDWGDMIEVPLARNRSGIGNNAIRLRSKVNTYETISDFVVNGIWKDGTAWDWLFNAHNIYKPEDPTKVWDYSPKKYWPQGGDVDFYAYAPASIINLRTGLYDNGNNSTPPVLEYAMPLKGDRETPPPGTGEPNSTPVVEELQEDLLVAVQHRTSPQTVAVPMNFRHAFSRVSVKAKMDGVDYANGYRIKVTRVDLRNLYTKGKLQLKEDAIVPGAGSLNKSTGIPMESTDHFNYDGTVTLWTNLDSLANYRFKLLSTVVIADDDFTSLVHSDDGIFVMPQQIVATNNSAVYVEYNIYTYSPVAGEQYVTSATKLIPLNNSFAFEIGRSYSILIELDAP